MGSFYLDIIKDRQYTSYRTGIPRRSAQTAMYYIVEALVRWLAPIISFTAEEIWQYLPGERQPSIFLSSWFDHFPQFDSASVINWPLMVPVRDAVNKLLEARRQRGEIGSALDANIILYADESLLNEILRLESELRFVLITSDAKVLPAAQRDSSAEATDLLGLWVKVMVSECSKCARCWQRREDVGVDPEHPALCSRCVENLSAPGEARFFA